MKELSKVAGAAVIGLLVGATASMAQGTLTGTTALDDRLDDISQNAQDDLNVLRMRRALATPNSVRVCRAVRR